MDLFKIDPKRSFEHDLRKIDRQFIPRILVAREGLSENPFPVQSRKMKGFVGAQPLSAHSLR
jgi:mRNA interferase RelE/StbE